MAIKDIESNLKVTVALAAIIASDTNTDGAILDTADFELGLMFTLDVVLFAAGDFELQIFESADSGMSGATQVVASKILPTTNTLNSVTLGAVVAQGAVLQKIGVFANLRYVRARIVSTNSADATVRVIATEAAEISPV